MSNTETMAQAAPIFKPTLKDYLALLKFVLFCAFITAIGIVALKAYKLDGTKAAVAVNTKQVAPAVTETTKQEPVKKIEKVVVAPVTKPAVKKVAVKKEALKSVAVAAAPIAPVEKKVIPEAKASMNKAIAIEAKPEIDSAKIAAIISSYDIEGVNSKKLAEHIANESAALNVNPLLVTAMVFTDSTFNERAVGPNNKLGLMQITPKEAKELSKVAGLPYLGKVTLFNSQVSLKIGLYKFNELLTFFNNEFDKALIAYNTGSIAFAESAVSSPSVEAIKYKDKVLNTLLEFRKK